MMSDCDIDFYKLKDVVHIRNMSRIKPKNNKSGKMCLNKKYLDIIFNSKYVHSIHNKHIKIPTHKLSYKKVDNRLINSKNKNILSIVWNENNIYNNLISIKSNKNIINKIITILKKGKAKNITNKMMKLLNPIFKYKIINHHYGDLLLFTKDKLNKMKPGDKYYITGSPFLINDFTGKNSIAVLQYNGITLNKNYNKKNIYNYKYFINGKVIFTDEIFDASGIGTNNKIFYGPGNVGNKMIIYLITKWQKGFKPPQRLPKAKLYPSN